MLEFKRDPWVVGANLVAVLAILALVWQRVIEWKVAGAVVMALLAPSLVKRKDDADALTPPPPWAILLVAGALFGPLSAGCRGLTPDEKAAAAESSYDAEMLDCVSQSSTRDESQACRQRVRAKWTVPDAGGGDR